MNRPPVIIGKEARMDKLVNKSSLREEKEASLMDKLINHPHFKEGEKVSFRINDTVVRFVV